MTKRESDGPPPSDTGLWAFNHERRPLGMLWSHFRIPYAAPQIQCQPLCGRDHASRLHMEAHVHMPIQRVDKWHEYSQSRPNWGEDGC